MMMTKKEDQYLTASLNALSRANKVNYFTEGHKGAAMAAAVYLCNEKKLDIKTRTMIYEIVENYWANKPLFKSFPEEPGNKKLLEQIIKVASENFRSLRRVGHDMIFTMYALRTFRMAPNLITPQRVTGVCQLIKRFGESDSMRWRADLQSVDDSEIPNFGDVESTACFILQEFLDTCNRFIGRGQGWSGHLLTVGHSLIELLRMGYDDLAKRGRYAFSQFVWRVRQGPQESDKNYMENKKIKLRPLDLDYWKHWGGRDPNLGHCFKYAFSFYYLLGLSGDQVLNSRCLSEAWRIF
jgi:hypothetical protein